MPIGETEIAERIGTPDLALLPISVGGTLTYVKSWAPAPAGYSLVPDIPEALTSSTHMSPGDATDLHRLLLGENMPPSAVEKGSDQTHETTSDQDPGSEPPEEREEQKEAQSSTPAQAIPGRKRMISMAVHFGTFCSGPAESRDTVRTLRRECKEKGVSFMKLAGQTSLIDTDQESSFVVVDHGGSVKIAF